jgi:hypothetical protein
MKLFVFALLISLNALSDVGNFSLDSERSLYIVDGDSMSLQMRIAGIDTPEIKQTCRKRVNKVIGNIVEEVLEHLTSDKDCTVNVSLEIEAKKTEGFSEDIIRTVSENCHTLKFDDFGFEEE